MTKKRKLERILKVYKELSNYDIVQLIPYKRSFAICKFNIGIIIDQDSNSESGVQYNKCYTISEKSFEKEFNRLKAVIEMYRVHSPKYKSGRKMPIDVYELEM